MVKYAERKAAEMERLTEATATGNAIAWSPEARDAWNRRRAAQGGGMPDDKVRGFHKLIGFLASEFPGSVRGDN